MVDSYLQLTRMTFDLKPISSIYMVIIIACICVLTAMQFSINSIKFLTTPLYFTQGKDRARMSLRIFCPVKRKVVFDVQFGHEIITIITSSDTK